MVLEADKPTASLTKVSSNIHGSKQIPKPIKMTKCQKQIRVPQDLGRKNIAA